MDAGTVRLLEFLNKRKSIYRIPVYQRKYEWTEGQVDQLFYDIEKIALDPDYRGHFLGTVVFVRSTFTGMGTDYTIIDGQQRITTTFLLLKAIYDTLEESDYRRDEIKVNYFINEHVEHEYKRKLISVESDRRDYEELLEHNKSDKPTKIHMNYNRLMYLIQHSKATAIELYDALSKVKIVYIELEQGRKDENPQTIFESLNSTGLSLTESDLIRNYLLMNEPPADQEILYKKYWSRLETLLTNAKISDFIRDYLTMKTAVISNKNKVYQTFKIYVQEQNVSSEAILEDLNKYAEHYNLFLNPTIDETTIQEHLLVILQLKSTVTYPYLLRLFDKYYNTKEISLDEFATIMSYITSYLVRRLIVNFPTNALNKVFGSMGKEIDNRKESISEKEAAVDFLMSRTGSATFPRNEKLKESIMNNDVYNRNHKLAKLILGKIESYSHKETVDFEQMTVEHIMPNKLTPMWRVELGSNATLDHTLYKDVLGNLTLTNYNSELSNKPFVDKKEYYSDSNLKITRDIANYNNWNKESIIKRANTLYEKIIRIWELPPDSYSKNKQEQLSGEMYYSVYEPITVTGKKPKMLKIFDDEYKVNNWKHTLVTYLEWLADFDLETYINLPKQRVFQKLLSYDKTVFRISEEVMGIYVETNLSAQYIYHYISSIAEYYDMEEEVMVQLYIT